MMYKNASALTGDTPLVCLSRFGAAYGVSGLVGKLEFLNPADNVKDRVGLALIDAAESDGQLTPDSLIIEPTSGNTGVGLAAVAAARGYRLILPCPTP